MNKFEKKDLQHDYKEAQTFGSQFAIDEQVEFRPMYRHQQEHGIADENLTGTIVSVRFTRAKVFYDVLSDYHGIIFDKVDSAKVYKNRVREMTDGMISKLKGEA